MIALLALTLCLPAQVAERPLSEVWVEHRLPNGLRAALVHAPELPDQAFVLVQPRGLVLDGADELQWAHLLEHLVLAASGVDREGQRPGELRVNAETTQSSLRFEAYAPPDEWERALDLHATWLATRGVDEALLASERGTLADELRVSIPEGATHKWAAAAWNQVVRHGAEHVDLVGDLTSLTAERINEALSPHRLRLDEMRLVSIGPVDPELVLDRLIDTLGVMGTGKTASVAATQDRETLRAPSDRQATWDVSARHYIETYLIPDGEPETRVAADALALLASVRLQQTPSLAQRGFSISAAADHITPEGTWFVLSSSLPPNESVETLRGIFASLLGSLAESPEISDVLGSMRRELSVWPDFAQLRAENAGHPGLLDVEVRQAVFLLYAELSMGRPLLELGPAYERLDVAALKRASAKLFRGPNRASMLLEPVD